VSLSGIYKIQSISHPERCYIGSAMDTRVRWNGHLYRLRKNKHHSKKLQYHYNKYGEDDLVFSIVVKCCREELVETEQKYINELHPYFNGSITAGSQLGFRHSKQSIEKMRNIKKGRVSWNKGKKASVETRLKSRLSHLGKSPSKENIAKRVFTYRLRKRLKKPIIQCDLQGNFIKGWDSATDAGLDLCLNSHSIRRCVRGERTTAFGFIWKSRNNDNDNDNEKIPC
jgi:group I intron endonuclease